MRLGFAIPQIGPNVRPAGLIAVAQRAEAIRFDSVWTLDRLLCPV